MGQAVRWPHCADRFQADQESLLAHAPPTPLNRLRAQVYAETLAAAPGAVGIYRMALPTGYGKTRLAVAFGLRHALQNNLARVIVAVPYISITTQNAAVYRRIFDDEQVIEHHSCVDFSDHAPRLRLAAENWDGPLVVTTMVQLLESLFANSPSRCRKLHRLARAVIVLDEVQSLPANLLDPILHGLHQLTAQYGSTIVLSTATQPVYEALPIWRHVQPVDVPPDPHAYFAASKRVTYVWRDSPVSWETVASWMHSEEQVAAIVNTKDDAVALYTALGDPDALLLSTRLCGAHRAHAIDEVRRRLVTGAPCRLVSTQVIEAGVDLDFPMVLRAAGPLTSIVQAAGRCNREGKLATGQVVIFQPETMTLPPGEYKRATQVTQGLVGQNILDMDDPATVRAYYERLYAMDDTDARRVQAARARLDYIEVDRSMRLIDSNSMPAVVFYGAGDERRQTAAWVQALADGEGNPRYLLRRLQPYIVELSRYPSGAGEFGRAAAAGRRGAGRWSGWPLPVDRPVRRSERRGLRLA